MNWRLFWRWAWRDLKARWLQVAVISLILALGTGIFTGLGGEKAFRINSMNKSYSRLKMYDLHVALNNGSFLPADEIETALSDIAGIQASDTRLIVPIQVDASTADKTILVEGALIGVNIHDEGPSINQIYINQGRNLQPDDSTSPAAVLDYKFARYYDLEPGDPIRIAGDNSLDFVGTGQSPEYFQIIPEGFGFLGEGSFSPIFMSLASVQQISGHTGLVNDVVILIDRDADREAVLADVEARFASQFPETGIETNFPEEDIVYKLLYEDAEGDQEIWNLMAILFLLGAGLGAFNLAGRMVQSQRREIGIAMALGVPRHIIALRPLMVGLQIALLGTVMGILVGFVLNTTFTSLIKDLAPLPYWVDTMHIPSLITGTLIGIVLPIIATLLPTWRAVRVAPVDAIRTGHLIAKKGGLSKYMAYLPIPGKSFMQMPFRNLFRAPWRAAFTIVGIAIAIALMTLFAGFLDTFVATIDEASLAYKHQSPDRLVVTLDDFYPLAGVEDIAAITQEDGQPLFAAWEGQLELGGTLISDSDSIDTALTLLDMESDIWTPMLKAGTLSSEAGTIVISDKMAEDLSVDVGDTVTLRHPHREGLRSFKFIESPVKVVGIHNNPLRPLSYMSMQSQSLMNIDSIVNQIIVVPAEGVSEDTVKQVLFGQDQVGAVASISNAVDAFDDALTLFAQFLYVIQGVVIFLAFLIAFNSTSLNVDERVREIATMFAFGLPIRTVTRMQIIENIVVGILGTLLGIGLGWIILNEALAARLESQLEDIQMLTKLEPQTLALSILLGIIVVALTPLLSVRKMSHMNIPNELRIME